MNRNIGVSNGMMGYNGYPSNNGMPINNSAIAGRMPVNNGPVVNGSVPINQGAMIGGSGMPIGSQVSNGRESNFNRNVYGGQYYPNEPMANQNIVSSSNNANNNRTTIDLEDPSEYMKVSGEHKTNKRNDGKSRVRRN